MQVEKMFPMLVLIGNLSRPYLIWYKPDYNILIKHETHKDSHPMIFFAELEKV